MYNTNINPDTNFVLLYRFRHKKIHRLKKSKGLVKSVENHLTTTYFVYIYQNIILLLKFAGFSNHNYANVHVSKTKD